MAPTGLSLRHRGCDTTSSTFSCGLVTATPYGQDVTSRTEQAAAFLAGTGRRLAPAAVRRLGLPADLAADATQEALLRVRRAELRGVAVEDLEAFTATLVRRAAHDLLRGRLRRPEGHLVTPLDDGGTDPRDLLAADDQAEGAALAGIAAGALRGRLGARLDDATVATCGALAVLAVVLDGAAPAEDCPAPRGGAGADDAAAWAGLFYAGCGGCFPVDGGVEDAAMRQRRSRAVGRQRRVLVTAASEVGVTAGGGDG